MAIPAAPASVHRRVTYRGTPGVVRGINTPRGEVWIRWDNPLCKRVPRVPAAHVYFEEEDDA